MRRNSTPTFLGRRSATANSDSTTSRASITARIRRPRRRPRWRCCCTRRPMYFYKKGKGRYRKAPPESLQAALASVERKQREAAQIAGWVADTRRATGCPTAFAREARDAAVQAGQELARMEGAGRGVRRAQHESGRSPCRLRRDSVDARLSLQPLPVRSLSARASRSRNGDRCPPPRTCRAPTCAPFPSTTRRPRKSTTPSRCASSRTATYEIGIHIACPALAMPRGSALDAIARERLSTVYMPGRKLTMLPEAAVAAFTLQGRRGGAGAFAVHRDRPRRRAGSARHAVESRAGRRQPAPRRRSPTRLPIRCRRRTTRRGRTRCARCGSSRSICRRAAARADFNRIDYSFDVDWDAGAEGRVTIVAARARQPARQAGRRTDDPRQQHVGAGCWRRAARRVCTACSRAAR